MILADSNIIIEYFRSRNSELSEKIDSMDIAVCGVIRTELLQGARNDKETDSLLEALNTFDTLPGDEYDWDGIGFMLQTMRSHGYTFPLADAIIAFTAIKYDIPLWTGDKHFKFIQGFYPELKLYGE